MPVYLKSLEVQTHYVKVSDLSVNKESVVFLVPFNTYFHLLLVLFLVYVIVYFIYSFPCFTVIYIIFSFLFNMFV